MKRYFFMMLFVLLSKTLAGKDIDKIKLVFGAEGTFLPISASCSPESFNFSFGVDINFLTTYDDIFIREFSSLYKGLLPKNEDDSIDAFDPRIMTVIIYRDYSIPNDTICLGEFYGISFNGELMEDNEALLNLVKRKIGWNRINRKSEFMKDIQSLKRYYSNDLLLLSIDHIVYKLCETEISDHYIIKKLLEQSSQNVDELLYKFQIENESDVLKRIERWCEVYLILNTYKDVDSDLLSILYNIPLIKNLIISFFNKSELSDKKMPNDEVEELLYSISNYISTLSDSERISFYEMYYKEMHEKLEHEANYLK